MIVVSVRRLAQLSVATCLCALASAGLESNAESVPPIHFEVFSIRPSKPGSGVNQTFAYSPDGYHAHNQFLGNTIAFAFYDQPYRYWPSPLLKGAPKWVDDLYDIDAKIDQKDVPLWRAQGRNTSVLRSALREALQERCRVLVHLETHDVTGLDLVLTKHSSSALTPSRPGTPIPDRAVQYSLYEARIVPGTNPSLFYSTSMKALAEFLSGQSQYLVYDATGLSGNYDFALLRDDIDPLAQHDPPSTTRFHLQDLGLSLQKARHIQPVLVIDHLDRPTPN